jgi:diadenosine tetraphosphate (Ap4A) HIT family hydrolase
MYDKNNVFAKILRGELPAEKIFENEFALAFHNISPAAKIHALVIPKGEFADIYDFSANATPEQQAGFWSAARAAADALGAGAGTRLLANTGAYQSVMHFHVHLLGDDKYLNGEM